MTAAIFFVVVLILAGAAWYLQALFARRRRQRYVTIAGTHSYVYSQHDPFRMIDTIDFDLFRRGRSKKAGNVMFGRSRGGFEIRGFEYRYTEGSGNAQQTYRWSCALLNHATDWPPLTLGPPNFFHHLLDVVTGSDIAFESEEFNREWEVRSHDRRFASALIDPELMLFLMEKAEGARFEINGPWLLFYTRQRDPEFLPEAIAYVEEFRSRLPPVVWSLYPVAEPRIESD